ncbi:MAG: putative 1,2-phenylacetyl-CoA epoxidase, subunit D [Actinobacteria bacterium ADurb.Bin346]|nr:MAG: putative 1,2-phenylacetyl-CoA epoxidase, subunit D [Actinobacteria bacterium ADurb.Bin346]
MQITKEDVLSALSEVYDPEIPVSIVDMGLIYKIDVDPDNNVDVDMTMTTKGCPMHSMITYQAQKRIEKMDGVGKVKVNLVWDPPWSPDMISQKIKDRLLKDEE